MIKHFDNIEQVINFYKEMVSKENLETPSEDLDMAFLITSIIAGEVLFKSGIPIENIKDEVGIFIDNNPKIIQFVSGVLKSKNE